MDTPEGIALGTEQAKRGSVIRSEETGEVIELIRKPTVQISGTQLGLKILTTGLFAVGLLWLFQMWVLPGLVSWVLRLIPTFVWPDWGFKALVSCLDIVGFVLAVVVAWFFAPELYVLPPNLRLVTLWLGFQPAERRKWKGIFVVFKPFEWPKSLVDTRAFAMDFIDINTTTKEDLPVDLNATWFGRIEDAVAAVFNLTNLKEAMSSIFEPLLLAVAGEEGYEVLKSEKGKVSKTLLEKADNELQDLKTRGVGLGLRVERFQLKDTPISDQEIRRQYAAGIEAEQEAKGIAALKAADIDYLSGIMADLIATYPNEITAPQALEAAIRRGLTHAIREQKGGTLLSMRGMGLGE